MSVILAISEVSSVVAQLYVHEWLLEIETQISCLLVHRTKLLVAYNELPVLYRDLELVHVVQTVGK